jgi:hypothetical protein
MRTKKNPCFFTKTGSSHYRTGETQLCTTLSGVPRGRGMENLSVRVVAPFCRRLNLIALYQDKLRPRKQPAGIEFNSGTFFLLFLGKRTGCEVCRHRRW